MGISVGHHKDLHDLAQLAGFLKLDNFDDLVLAAPALINALIITLSIQRYTNEQHPSAALLTAR
jgi:hypothetical protein